MLRKLGALFAGLSLFGMVFGSSAVFAKVQKITPEALADVEEDEDDEEEEE